MTEDLHQELENVTAIQVFGLQTVDLQHSPWPYDSSRYWETWTVTDLLFTRIRALPVYSWTCKLFHYIMPIYALLGATGSTGGAVLQCLLDEPIKDLHLRLYVRSKSKLLKSFPDLEISSLQYEITEATLDDTLSLQKCLDGTEVIYNCIASNDSAPGVSVAQEAAKAVIAALEVLQNKRGSEYIKPTLLINRSTSLNDKTPSSFSKSAAHYALFYSYDDIAKACNLFLTASDNDKLMDFIRVDPPALHASTKRSGYELSLDKATFRSLNYPDLGAAFVEIGQRRQDFHGKEVIVGATGDVEEHWDVLRGYLLRGLKARFFGV